MKPCQRALEFTLELTERLLYYAVYNIFGVVESLCDKIVNGAYFAVELSLDMNCMLLFSFCRALRRKLTHKAKFVLPKAPRRYYYRGV